MNEPFSFEHEMGDARESLARGFARLLGTEAGAAVARGETRVAITREGAEPESILFYVFLGVPGSRLSASLRSR